MTDTPSIPNFLPPEGTETLLDQIFHIWVEPAITERSLGLGRADVTKALVALPPTEAPRVLINDEVDLIAQMRVARSLEEGEAIRLEDGVSVERLQPARIDPNAGWIAFAKIGPNIVIAFDFRRNRETAQLLVGRANDFEDAARHSLSAQKLGPAIENAFAAMELAIKAEMYLINDSPTTHHPERVTWWSAWVALGNAPQESDAILERLYRERPASRYGDRPISMSPEEVEAALDRVHTVIEHARAACAESNDPG